MTSGRICLMKQKKVFALQKSSTPTGLIWYTNMGDFSLFRYTNMAEAQKVVEAREKACLVARARRLMFRISAERGWAMKRAVRSSCNVSCGVGLARALFPRFRQNFPFSQPYILFSFFYIWSQQCSKLNSFLTVFCIDISASYSSQIAKI